MNTSNVGPSMTSRVSCDESSQESKSGFRSHLARALSGAAEVAAHVASPRPVAGAVAAGLGGVSRLLDSEGATTADSTGDLERTLSETRSLNAEYIALQSRMQAESQAFTAVSNVLKSRHESAQNALNNIR